MMTKGYLSEKLRNRCNWSEENHGSKPDAQLKWKSGWQVEQSLVLWGLFSQKWSQGRINDHGNKQAGGECDNQG